MPAYKNVVSRTRRYTHAVTVYMTNKMARAIAAEAKERGITIASVVREAVDMRYAQTAKEAGNA